MPSKYNMETLPIPNDPRISIRKINHRKTAVFKTSGWHSKEKLEKHTQNLQVWLEREKLGKPVQSSIMIYDPIGPYHS